MSPCNSRNCWRRSIRRRRFWTAGGRKTLREHLEVINHASALDLLEELVERREPLTAFVARQLHALILRGIDDANAGRERQVPVAISGSHVPPPPASVPAEMHDLFAWYQTARHRNIQFA